MHPRDEVSAVGWWGACAGSSHCTYGHLGEGPGEGERDKFKGAGEYYSVGRSWILAQLGANSPCHCGQANSLGYKFLVCKSVGSVLVWGRAWTVCLKPDPGDSSLQPGREAHL